MRHGSVQTSHEAPYVRSRMLKTLVLLYFTMLVVVPMVPAAAAQANKRLRARSEDGRVTNLSGHHPAWANMQNNIGVVPDDVPIRHITVVLNRPQSQEKAYKMLLREQQDPASANYHRWLSPQELGERFGPSQHDIQMVTRWLAAQGLHVDSISSSRTFINISGTAATVANAFSSEFHYYFVNGERYISLATDPVIPAELSTIVKSVHGLSSFPLQPMHKLVAVDGSKMGGIAPDMNLNPVTRALSPADFAAIYDINPVLANGVTGLGQTIAIIGRSRVSNADIEAFQKLFGFAAKDPAVVIPPDGVDPGPPKTDLSSGYPSADQQEATLDVTRAGSVAPGASILLVVSASTSTADGVDIATQYAVDTTPVVAQELSISFGGCEVGSYAQAALSYYDALFQQAAGEGMSVFVSSGDSGAAGCDSAFVPAPSSQFRSINLLCASGYATCVGGTEFADAGNPGQYWSPTEGSNHQSAFGYIPEGAWNESGSMVAGSGGGMSTLVVRPSWQTGHGILGSGRLTPDVAFSSSQHDPYIACLAVVGANCQTSYAQFAGTSAAAPSMAGIAALLNQQEGIAQGNLNPQLYNLAASPSNGVFHDVTVVSSGVSACDLAVPSMCNNTTPSPTSTTGGVAGYLVQDGYDAVTGWGSIDVAKLLANWSDNGQAPALLIGPSPISFGFVTVNARSASQIVTLTNSGTAVLSVSSLTISGANGSDFQLTNGTCLATPFNLPPGQSCLLLLSFSPTSAAVETATFTVADNSRVSSQSVPLSGTGVAQGTPIDVFSPASLTFNNVPYGTTSAPQTVTLTNGGTGVLTVSGFSFAYPFFATSNCYSVQPGASCTFQVTFSAARPGAYTGSITVRDNSAGNPQVLALDGVAANTGTPLASLSATSLDFGALTVGSTSAPQSATLTNTGTGLLVISSLSLAGYFSQTNTCTTSTLAPGGSCVFQLSFKPSVPGPAGGVLTITDNAAGSPHVVNLTGTALNSGTPAITFSPASLSFPVQNVGTTTQQTLTLTNTGTGVLMVSRYDFEGSSAFFTTNNCYAVLSAGSSCQFQVSFTPNAATNFTNILVVSDNAPNSPQTTVVTGSGGSAGSAATTTTLTATPASAPVGTSVTFTATVGTQGSVKPNGSVVFLDGPTPLSGVWVNSSGTASFSANSLTTGTHSITAVYQGDSSNAGSISAPFSVTMQPVNFTLNVLKKDFGGGSVTSAPAGINCGAVCSAVFSTGTVITLTAVPSPGSVFDGWGGACSGVASTCQLNLTSNQGTQSVMAYFGGVNGRHQLAPTH